MLWNAKMRFGKTFSALQVVKEMEYTRTLILTHRPVVDEAWFDCFGQIFYDRPEYRYGSKTKGERFNALEQRTKNGKGNYLYFVSMQDLRGSELVGGRFNKNDEVFETPWDLIIVDEAHEGTQTELGTNVLTDLKKKDTKVLLLSGTPFNLLDDYEQSEIFTWDYVMEQRAKTTWDEIHCGDPNPYASLPRLNIFTYDLGKLLTKYIDEDVAFNFREFFRTDQSGKFVHEKDVRAFLKLICKPDAESAYPFSTKEYCDNFRHSLWMVPGVKEARALSALLQAHPVFGQYSIVNVAGDGDEEEAFQDALKQVQGAITDKPHETYSITISCGRLTTGVTVPAWTAVFMLSGSFNTSAMGYMQTIFRVQSPAVINGKVKEDCFVFDFAPDRTLKVIAETAKISAKAGQTSESDKQIMGELLNFCPVIGYDGSRMRNYNVNSMLEQLKKVYVERVVRHGFEDGYLYNNDELMKLDDVQLTEFDKLKKIIGSTKAMPKTGDIDVNLQGFSDEKYEQAQEAEKKKRAGKVLSEEEQRLLKEKAEKKKNRDTAVSILRGISIRMPLLIFGADVVNEETELSLDNFTELVDDKSWKEFMPNGVTKKDFKKFKKYYEQDVFRAAGKRIRLMARAADELSIEERVERITDIFATFRNPDKETVLTPWRVVNMHLGDCLGGYEFFDENHEITLEEPRFVDRGEVTKSTFAPDSRILEINAKSGLYSLYAGYSIYRARLAEEGNQSSLEKQLEVWDKVVAENLFVICKTPMAKSIAKRTLIGFRKAKVNTRYFEDLINQITQKPQKFVKQIRRGKTYWKSNEDENMKFNAIVGNPPYQVMDGGHNASSTPVYNHFVNIGKELKPLYLSLIMPARWLNGGKGLDDFRTEMLNDDRMRILVDFEDANECFPGVDIAGGVCYFLWEQDSHGACEVVNIHDGIRKSSERELNEFDKFIRHGQAISIVKKVLIGQNEMMNLQVSSYKPFGLRTYVKPQASGDIILFWQKGEGPYKRKDITTGIEMIDKWKVVVSRSGHEHAGNPGVGGARRVLSRTAILPPATVCTETYLVAGSYSTEKEAENLLLYMKTRFFRFLMSLSMYTHGITKDTFTYVPILDMSQVWTDSKLYAKYNLTEDEIEFIESKIKPMS